METILEIEWSCWNVKPHDAVLFLWYSTHLWTRPHGLLPSD